MSVSHSRDLKSKTGGRHRAWRDKRKSELGGLPTNSTIGKEAKRAERGYGGNSKLKARRLEKANVFDPKTKKWLVVTLRTEKENPANRNFARQNLLTKGAVIDTDQGTVRITNRPGQEGVVNAVKI